MPKTSKTRRLRAVDLLTPEERYLRNGGERPAGFGLCNATSKEGLDARAGIHYLLTQIRTSGRFAKSARNILKSCASPGDTPLNWIDLRDLGDNYWHVTKPLLEYVWRTGGLRPEDFDDGGQEFYHWVFQGLTPTITILERETYA